MTFLDPVLLVILFSLLTVTLYSDLKYNKIKNLWVGVGTLLGFILHLYLGSWTGLASSVLGFLVGFGVFLPLYLLGGMAAGDVKLMAAVGALVGSSLAWITVILTLLSGALIALVYLAIRRDLNRYVSRYIQFFRDFIVTRNIGSSYHPPANDEVAAQHFPYVLAVASGVIISLILFMSRLPGYMLTHY